MRPKGSAKMLEERRRRAMELLAEGLSLNEVAKRIGCNASSVMRWRNALQSGGKNALAPKPVPGRPPKLKAKEKRSLVKHLMKGAIANGYSTDLWTTQRIAEIIQKKFGVRYHRDHIGRLMSDLGWSHQKPERRSVQRNEKEIERWKREEWPRVKKTPRGWAPISCSSTNPVSC